MTASQLHATQQALAIRHTLNRVWAEAPISQRDRMRGAFMAAMVSDWAQVAHILRECVTADREESGSITHWANRCYFLARELEDKVKQDAPEVIEDDFTRPALG